MKLSLNFLLKKMTFLRETKIVQKTNVKKLTLSFLLEENTEIMLHIVM
jgi:hypothetical protein